MSVTIGDGEDMGISCGAANPVSQPCVPAHALILCSAGHIFSLSPAPLSFQMSLSCPEITQKMATMMPERFLIRRRESGKCPGCRMKEKTPGMHPEVRGKDSTACS